MAASPQASRPDPFYWKSFGAGGKFALIVGLMLVILLVPLGMVRGVMKERGQRYQETASEIGASWGKPQFVAGPILVLPFATSTTDAEGQSSTRVSRYILLPYTLALSADVQPEVLHRGIFEAVVYEAAISMSGVFRLPNDLPADPDWGRARILIGLSDARGVDGEASLRWAEAPMALEPMPSGDILAPFAIALGAPLAGLAPPVPGRDIPFSATFSLRGSDQLAFGPFGRATDVSMTAPWASPSFVGGYLPQDRDISADAFTAAWHVSHLGRGFPQAWSEDAEPSGLASAIDAASFGARFIQPVDPYLMAERSAKYGILFLVFTFFAYFVFEVRGQAISVVQYGFVGLAVCLFYLLLLSLSEAIGFGWAYAVSTLAVVGQTAAYTVAVTRSARRAAAFGGLLAAVYAYLFILLNQETYALLGGSLGLFLLLSGLMYLTRNVDWSRTLARMVPAATAPPAVQPESGPPA